MQKIQALWKNGEVVLKGQPDWPDGSRLVVAPVSDEHDENWLDVAFLRYVETQADDSITLEQVRSGLAKIPGSMVEDFRSERDERS
jgi:hypothetical protein